jgi:hypothetical protein
LRLDAEGYLPEQVLSGGVGANVASESMQGIIRESESDRHAGHVMRAA